MDNKPDYEKKILSYYNKEGKLSQYPTKRPLREIVLSRIAEQFVKDRTYTEKEINQIIISNIDFSDVETIRRELFQYGYIGRLKDGSKYWKE